MINNCKTTILEFKKQTTTGKKSTMLGDDNILWDHEKFPPSELIPLFKSCIDLNFAYEK